MAYSSSLSDQEWKIFEPLFLEILPKKKRTRRMDWSYREIFDGILYRLKNGCNWEDLPKDLPPCLGARSLGLQSDAGSHRYSTVSWRYNFWHYNQWRKAGVFEDLMQTLHEQVREQVKKAQVDNIDYG